MALQVHRFFYHFNKPMTQKTGEVFWTVHYRQKCYMVKSIDCSVPTQTKTNRQQPRAVVQGLCRELIIENDTAIIR